MRTPYRNSLRLTALALMALAPLSLPLRSADPAGDAKKPGTGNISFAQGAWDRSRWTPVRLPHQLTTPAFIQRKDSLGTDSFTAGQRKKKLDNVLLLFDTGMGEGQFEVEFRIGPERGTAPGFFLAPTVTDGVLDQAVCVFVASYTMAAWLATTNRETGETTYKHLARLNRWSEPGKRHVFRCRYSAKRNALLLQVDDSDVLMLRDVGARPNTKIGIWGCHGTCDYYRLQVLPGGNLPWSAVASKK